MDGQGPRARQGGGATNNYDYSERAGYGERDRRRNDREVEKPGGYGNYGGSDYGRDARQPQPRLQQRELAPSGTEQGYGRNRSRERSRERDPSRGPPRQNGVKGYGPGTRNLEGERNTISQMIFMNGDRNTEVGPGIRYIERYREGLGFHDSRQLCSCQSGLAIDGYQLVREGLPV